MPTDPAALQAAADAVAAFLRAAIDQPDEAKAMSFLAPSSSETSFSLPNEMKNAKYTLAPPTEENGQIYVAVTVTDPATGMSQVLPLAPVLIAGEWKLDMEKMMHKLMGPMMAAMTEGLGNAMSAVGDAIGSALGAMGANESPSDAPTPLLASEKALAHFHERLQRLLAEARNRFDVDLPLDIDLPSLLTADSEQANDRLLDTLSERALFNYPYALDETNKRFPLADRVKSLRLEGVPSAAQRAVFSEGARIVYRLNLVDSDGYYDGSDLARILTGVAAPMSEESRGELRKGPSFRPNPNSSTLVDDYKDLVLPVLSRRLGEIVGHDVPVDIMWSSLEYSGQGENFWVWGLNRLVGALALLAADPASRPALAELTSVRITIVDYPGGKSLRYSRGELEWYFSPKDGEAGCFYEADIADALSAGLKLKTRPMVAELERYCATWEKQILELFGRPIRYSVDFEAFTADPDQGKNVFALTLLREHGIDRLFYALTSLAEKNPNFKQQFPQRIAWLRIENAFSNENKSISGEQTCILYRLYVHQGYNGYLLPKEVEKQLPAIVAAMPEISWDGPPLEESRDRGDSSPADPDASLQEEIRNLHDLHEDQQEDREMPRGDIRSADDDEEEQENEEAPQPTADEAADKQRIAAFEQLKVQISNMLPVYAQQFAAVIGKIIPLDVDWNSLDRQPETIGLLLNAGLTPLLGGFNALARDPITKAQLHTLVDRVLLRQSKTAADHGFSFDKGTLIYATTITPGLPPMDPQLAATFISATMHSAMAGQAVTDPVAPPVPKKKSAPNSSKQEKPGLKKKPKKKGK